MIADKAAPAPGAPSDRGPGLDPAASARLAEAVIERVNALSEPGGLAAWRERLGISRRTAAKELGCEANTIAKYDKTPDAAPLYFLYACAVLELCGKNRPLRLEDVKE